MHIDDPRNGPVSPAPSGASTELPEDRIGPTPSEPSAEPLLLTHPDGRAPRLRIHLASPSGAGPCAFILPGLALPARSAGGFGPALAVELARRGISVVRPEPRYSAPQGTPLDAIDWHTEIDDAVAALRFTLEQSFVDPTAVHLLGLSLGGIAAPIVAGRVGHCATIASWAATGRGWPAYAEDNLRRQLLWTSTAVEQIQVRVARYRRWHELLVETRLDAAAMLEVAPTLSELGVTPAGFLGRPTDFWRQLCRFDPAASYEGLTCGLLTVRGAADFMCHPEDQQAIIRAAQSAGIAPQATTLEGLDHSLRAANSPREACVAGGGTGPSRVDRLAERFAEWIQSQGRAERD